MSIKDKVDYYEIETIEDALELFSNLEYNVKLKTNNTMRPYVQEIIDLTKQVDDLTSDNVDLKEQLKDYDRLKDRNLGLEQILKNYPPEIVMSSKALPKTMRERFIKEIEKLQFKIEDIIEYYNKKTDILWEYISDKDVDEISDRFNKI